MGAWDRVAPPRPHARPTGKGGGCVCPMGLWGQRKLGGGRGGGLRLAQHPEGGAFWSVSLSSVQPASPPSNLLPDIPGKSLFLLRLMTQPRSWAVCGCPCVRTRPLKAP